MHRVHVCSQTQCCPWRIIDCVGGHLLQSQAAKHFFGWTQGGCSLSKDTCFMLLFSVWVWHGDFSGKKAKIRQSIFWSFIELLSSLIDHAPMSIYRCRGQEHSTVPHSHAPPVAYTLVMTNGKGHTLALCIPHAASYPVMDSPPCHHHLLLGPGQNQ